MCNSPIGYPKCKRSFPWLIYIRENSKEVALVLLQDPTIGASSRPPDMNMLTVDPDPPNPISSFLKTLTLNDSREPFVLPVIKDSDLASPCQNDA